MTDIPWHLDPFIMTAYREPNNMDWKYLPNLFLNLNTDQIFIKGSKGWIKVPTEYAIMHKKEMPSHNSVSEDI